MKEFSRTERVADFLKEELGSLIQLKMRDPRVGMASVTDVEVSRDLSYARVFVTVMGRNTAEEAREPIEALNRAAGYLRTQLARVNKARTTPQLRFYFDTSIGRGEHLSRLIEDAIEADRKHHSGSSEE